jgi:hypothetical protein
MQEGELCNSHIIPEFFYKPLYDELHRCLELNRFDEPSEKKTHQKGLREHLLCADCDNGRLGKHEDYMARVFFGRSGVSCQQINAGIIVENLSYEHVRLFQLSMLWRASISSLSEFSEVALGPHEESIRKMLLTDDPGEPDQYPCILCVPSEIRKKLEDKAIKMPQTQRLKGHRSYDFYCGGLGWVYIVSSHIRGNLGDNKVVTPGGEMPILFDWR